MDREKGGREAERLRERFAISVTVHRYQDLQGEGRRRRRGFVIANKGGEDEEHTIYVAIVAQHIVGQ